MRKNLARLTLLLLFVSGCSPSSQSAPPTAPNPPPAMEAPAPTPAPAARVKTGLEVLLTEQLDLLEGKRIGLITNPTGVLPDLTHAIDALSEKTNLVAAFGPEHGVRGTAQAGEQTGDLVDPKTGLPFFALYGKAPSEIAELFDKAQVDLVLFDIQDIGTRFYTYIWTMYQAMEAAAQTGVQFVVLDRPNPTGGLEVEGPVLDPSHATFVGLQPIAQRHGLTVGELAQLFNGEFLSNRVDLTVVPMVGWDRAQHFNQTGLPWVLPSPNMPTVATALVYSGTGLIEGTNLSEGRGTTKPFELIGAPYIDYRLADALNAMGLPGVAFREAYFTPTFSKYEGQTVGGVELFVTDSTRFEPITTALQIIKITMELYPDQFAWRDDNWIDKLTGTNQVRTMLDAGKSVDEIVASWQTELETFKATRQKYLLY